MLVSCGQRGAELPLSLCMALHPGTHLLLPAQVGSRISAPEGVGEGRTLNCPNLCWAWPESHGFWGFWDKHWSKELYLGRRC